MYYQFISKRKYEYQKRTDETTFWRQSRSNLHPSYKQANQKRTLYLRFQDMKIFCHSKTLQFLLFFLEKLAFLLHFSPHFKKEITTMPQIDQNISIVYVLWKILLNNLYCSKTLCSVAFQHHHEETQTRLNREGGKEGEAICTMIAKLQNS